MTMRAGMNFFSERPLLRLLAINLSSGVALALLMVGGLFALNPYGLRDLILADHSGFVAIGLLLFGFVVTFGSTAMATAVMSLGRDADSDSGGKLKTAEPSPVSIKAL